MTEYIANLREFEKDHEPSFYESEINVLMDLETVSTIKNNQFKNASFMGVFC
ncbi:MAG: hypothetical protein AAB446_00335 [Patescibacteria group bacterium]